MSISLLLFVEDIFWVVISSGFVFLVLIKDVVNVGRTVVLTTHNLSDAGKADQVLLLNNCPCCVGTPDEVLTEPNLRKAFGENEMRVGTNIFLDDPHHTHVSESKDEGIRTF